MKKVNTTVTSAIINIYTPNKDSKYMKQNLRETKGMKQTNLQSWMETLPYSQ